MRGCHPRSYRQVVEIPQVTTTTRKLVHAIVTYDGHGYPIETRYISEPWYEIRRDFAA